MWWKISFDIKWWIKFETSIQYITCVWPILRVRFYLQTVEVAFLRTHVQRRATPQVPDVDLSSVSQKVTDDEVLISGSRDVQSRLQTKRWDSRI